VILLLYPTAAADYSVPTLFGFVPLMSFWARRTEVGPPAMRTAVQWLFLGFLAVAPGLTSVTRSTWILFAFYALVAAVLLVTPSALLDHRARRAAPIAV
jgi:hypothetical protein